MTSGVVQIYVESSFIGDAVTAWRPVARAGGVKRLQGYVMGSSAHATNADTVLLGCASTRMAASSCIDSAWTGIMLAQHSRMAPCFIGV